MVMISKFKETIDNMGIRQSHIVEKAKVNKSTVSNLYKNGAIPTYPVAYKISKVINVPMETMWYDDEFI